MYHFKPTEHGPETTILNEHTELSGRAIKFLKDFQIGAVRFLFEQFCKRDFSILNDESGLGKTAAIAVFLGIVAVRKRCLIVVSNNEECINGWRFHLDILTDLNVSVLNTEKDYVTTDYRVYIAQWNTLRTIGDLSKFNFELIIVDNREQILSNTFCLSTLLKNYERKVQLVLSSVDVTSDVKLLHNILRLGGRLEHQLESFKAFEQKFKLPDLKAISSKRSDLEEYFLKREILNDYCRDFRLRRYCHQFENMLPLVDAERYKAFLKEWLASSIERTENSALLIGEQLPLEIDTEELLEQYQTNPERFDRETATTPTAISKHMNNTVIELTDGTQNTMPAPTALDVTDDLMEMPPLVFVTDSEDENEDEDVIFLSSESADAAAAAIPVIEIEEDDEKTNEKPATTNVKAEKLSPKKQPTAIKANNSPEKTLKQPTAVKANSSAEKAIKQPAAVKANSSAEKTIMSPAAVKANSSAEKTMNTRQKNKRKSTTPQQLRPTKTTESATPHKNQTTTPSTRSKQQNLERTRRSVGKNAESKPVKTTPANKKGKESKQQQKTPPQKQSATASLRIKAEKLSPNKNAATTAKTKSAENLGMKLESPQNKKDIAKKLNKSTSELEVKKRVEQLKENKTSTPMTPTDNRRSQKKVSTPIVGVPLRNTRSMQRNTRSSGGKRKCFALEFDDDNKKPRTQVKNKQTTAAEKIKNTKKAENVPLQQVDESSKDKQPTKIAKKSQAEKDKQPTKTAKKNLTSKGVESVKATTTPTPTDTKKTKTTATKSVSSTQSSFLPGSSEYEEIQCGQKLYSSSDNSPQLIEKQNEFLKPATPPSFRFSQYPITRLVSNDSDSDVTLLLPSSSSQKRKSNADAVVVLSSSQDEASLSSQSSAAEHGRSAKSTTATGTQKRKRLSKRMSLPSTATKEPLTFGDLLSKQRETAKSPDLFSVGSDAGVLTQGSSNVLPYSQPNGKAATTPATKTTPTFGFKIFGSEVRGFQQSKAAATKPTADNKQTTTRRPTRGGPSCLNILEQMFEQNTETISSEKRKSVNENAKAKALRKSRHTSRTQATASTSASKQSLINAEVSSQQPQPAPRKPIHSSQKQQQKATGESDDIFEITNNATFGSTLRISASGHISPVPAAAINSSNNQPHHSNSHNKITSYFIGNGSGNEQLLKTPSKRSQQQQSLPGSGGSGAGANATVATTQTRKSPKSVKSTQTTKLTKWFRRSSVDESCLNKSTQQSDNNARIESSKSAKLVKRRRLDLSFKS